MNKWRPGNWDRVFKVMDTPHSKIYGAFECGADAMLEAKDTENTQALVDYTDHRISFERLAERLGVNFYVLASAFRERVIPDDIEDKPKGSATTASWDINKHNWSRYAYPTGDFWNPYNSEMAELSKSVVGVLTRGTREQFSRRFHSATKIIEEGYFCDSCFKQIPYNTRGFHLCGGNTMLYQVWNR